MSEAPTVAAGSPKLLELDKKDVEAVRSFLPGKVLGRTAALLALVLLVLGFAGSLDVAVEKFLGFPLEPPWLKSTVLIGFPVLIVAAQILAEWRAERKRRQAQALAVKVEAVPEDYFRIGPYLDTAEDRAKFARADRAHEKVLAWLKRANATPLYLTGDSGSGKSSPSHCVRASRLREAGWTVVEARAWQDPETALSEAITKIADVKAPSLDADLLVRHYIEQSVEQPAIRPYAPPVLKEVVTEQGTKRPRNEQELVDLTGLRLGEVRAVMGGLWLAALARPLDATHGVWELSHDFVARAVSRYLGRQRFDWLGIVRGYAAPGLLAMMAVGAIELYSAGIKASKDILEEVEIRRNYAVVLFMNRHSAEGREQYKYSLSLLDKYHPADPELSVWSRFETELSWAWPENAVNQCVYAKEHLAAAEKLFSPSGVLMNLDAYRSQYDVLKSQINACIQ